MRTKYIAIVKEDGRYSYRIDKNLILLEGRLGREMRLHNSYCIKYKIIKFFEIKYDCKIKPIEEVINDLNSGKPVDLESIIF